MKEYINNILLYFIMKEDITNRLSNRFFQEHKPDIDVEAWNWMVKETQRGFKNKFHEERRILLFNKLKYEIMFNLYDGNIKMNKQIDNDMKMYMNIRQIPYTPV